MLICGILNLIFWGYMLHRNKKVGRLRHQMISIIFSFPHDYEWRVKEYRTVSYNTMLYKFWIPLKVENFYKDMSFLMDD